MEKQLEEIKLEKEQLRKDNGTLAKRLKQLEDENRKLKNSSREEAKNVTGFLFG